MILELDKDIRPRQREASDQLSDLREEIAREIEEKYRASKKAMYKERESLYEVERDFVKSISDLFKSKKLGLNSKIKIVVQVGPQASVLREHSGEIVKIYDTYKPCFDLSDPNYLNGKKFTIGSSCIQKIEIL